MSDLDQAIADLKQIRRRVAQTKEFHGYGPATLFATAFLAAAAGRVQARWLIAPVTKPASYVIFWLGIAVFCALLIAMQMFRRARSRYSELADEMMFEAVIPFLPAAGVGVAVPLVLLHVAPGACWMLPGLWQIILGLGIFASRASMPQAMGMVGLWFLCCATGCLLFGESGALAPVLMSAPFAIGMTAVAMIHLMAAKEDAESDDEAI